MKFTHIYGGIDDEENQEVEPYKHPHSKTHVEMQFEHRFDKDVNHEI